MRHNRLNALHQKLWVLALTLILAITLPGFVAAMDLGGQLGDLQSKLVGLKGKLGQLKGGLEKLKDALDGKAPSGEGSILNSSISTPQPIDWNPATDEILVNIKRQLNDKYASVAIKAANRQFTNNLQELLIQKNLINDSDTIAKISSIDLDLFLSEKLDDAVKNIIAPIKKHLLTLKKLFDDSSESSKSNAPEKAFSPDEFLNPLKNDTPTQAEFDAKWKDYVDSFFVIFSGQTDENIKDVIKGLKASHTCFTTKLPKKPSKADENNATFKNISNLVDFLHATYLNKILSHPSAILDLQTRINTASQANLLNELINEYDKLYKLPQLAEKISVGKNAGKTQLEVKEIALETKKNIKDLAIQNLTTTLNHYQDNQILTLQQINDLIKGDALKSLKVDNQPLHTKADSLIQSNLTPDFFKKNLKTKELQSKLKQDLKISRCENALTRLNELIKIADDAEKILSDEKAQLISTILKQNPDLDESKLKAKSIEALRIQANPTPVSALPTPVVSPAGGPSTPPIAPPPPPLKKK